MLRFLDSDQLTFSPGVICLGFFDGVHLGHQAIVNRGKTVAAELNLPLYVHTYEIPPANVIKHPMAVKEISPLPEKAALLERLGVDTVAVSRFDQHMMHMDGGVFFVHVLLGRLQAKHVVVGYDHRFGFRGSTDVKALAELCREHGVGLSVVDAVKLPDGREISSTAIRTALTRGDIDLAQRMLGRPVEQALKDRFSLVNGEREKVEEGFA